MHFPPSRDPSALHPGESSFLSMFSFTRADLRVQLEVWFAVTAIALLAFSGEATSWASVGVDVSEPTEVLQPVGMHSRR